MNTKKAAEMCCFFKNICDIIVTTKKNGGLRQWHISRPVLDRNGIAVQGQVFQNNT